MISPANLPSMFGRFTAILQDDAHLGATLRELLSMCVTLETRKSLLTTVASLRLLEDLHDDLSGHFAAEEAESYFGTIADEAPLLAPRIGRLKSEHAAMLGATVALRRVAADDARGPELSGGTRRLIAELDRHEHAESLLLRDLFGLRQPAVRVAR